MTTETLCRTTTSRVTKNGIPLQQPQDFCSCIHRVGTEVREAVQLGTTIVLEFQGAVKAIQPLLSIEHQNQINEIFLDYQKFLMINRRFLTRSLILATRAKTAHELMLSINIENIQQISNTIQVILKKLYALHPIVKEKLKEQQSLERLSKIFGLCAIIGGGACAALLGYGALSASGITKSMKVYLTAASSITVATSMAAIATHVAQHVSAFDELIMLLKETQNGLIQLSQNYPDIEVMSELLWDTDGSKQDFIKLLKETDKEVGKGFELLKKL